MSETVRSLLEKVHDAQNNLKIRIEDLEVELEKLQPKGEDPAE